MLDKTDIRSRTDLPKTPRLRSALAVGDVRRITGTCVTQLGSDVSKPRGFKL